MSHVKEQVYGRLNYRTENYIERPSDERFEVILCLSTVKWVHLSYGDTGVKALFLKVASQLNRGGLFIFEQQPWKSYRKCKHAKGVKIEFKPNLFKQYLQQLGFKLQATVSECEKPIYVYRKCA